MSIDPRDQRMMTLEQLLGVQEDIAIRQTRAYEQLLAAREVEASRLRDSERRLQVSEARKAAVLQASADALITINAHGIIQDFNRAAETIFGYSAADVIGSEMAELIVPTGYREAHRAGLARYVRTRKGSVLNKRLQMPALRSDGSEFTAELTIVAVQGSDEILFTGQLRDITEQLAAAEQLRHLQLITDAALASLSLDELLPALVERLEEMLEADAVGIMFLIGEDMLELQAGSGLIIEPGDRYRIEVGKGLAGRVAAEGRSVQVEDITSVPGISPVLINSGLTSVLGAPLIASDQLIGVVHVGRKEKRIFTQAEIGLLERVAARISLGVAHARSFERERGMSQAMQLSLLPARLDAPDCLEIHVHYTASSDEAHVGGDWYDVMPLQDGRIMLNIGDVMGHDTQAASVMGQLRWGLRAYALDDPDPARVLARLNRLTRSSSDAEMASICFGIYDPKSRKLTYGNAGHPPPLLIRAEGGAEFLEIGLGPVIGAVEEPTFQSRTVELAPDDIMMCFTDGLIEVPGIDLDMSMQALVDLIPEKMTGLRDLATKIDLNLPSGDRPTGDDSAYLLIRVR